MSVSCVEGGTLCVPRGDDKEIVVCVYDSDGNEFDISGADEITFIVADGEIVGGNMGPGGNILITKTMTDGDITVSGSLYKFMFFITAAESATLPRTSLYYEAQIVTGSGLKYTVAYGIFTAKNTMIKDI